MSEIDRDDAGAFGAGILGERWRDRALLGCAALSVGVHLWFVFSGLIPSLVARPLHLALGLPFVFLFAPARSAADRLFAGICALAGGGACLYVVVNRPALIDQYGALKGFDQYLLAAVLILVVLEMARRAVQPALPTFAALTLLYGFFGDWIPGQFGHPGVPVEYMLGTLVIAEGGLWGSLTGISVDLIVPFLILGSFVSAGEAGNGFMALSTQLAGRFRAGAAKVAVMASAMYGTISGSASANVASTGVITVPAMVRLGYPRPFAAAIEAVASTGGQIMPPVMGAGVFLMAEFLRTTYADLMVAALLPALLYFYTAWVGAHHFALRHDLRGLAASELPGWARVARTAPFFLLPFGILVAMLMVGEYAAPYSAVFATAVTVVLLSVNSAGTISSATWWRRFQTGLVDAANQTAFIAAVIVCSGVIVGVFAMTGVGVKITSAIISLSGGHLWPALVMTALACLVLGAELPTTAAYLICIAVAGPALQKLGLPELHAHLFVFWYALLCTLTPPVAGNVFIAANIAKTPWMPVAWLSMRLGMGLFVIPLGFVANPTLLHLAGQPWLACLAGLKLAAGIWLMSHGVIRETAATWRSWTAFAAGTAVVFAFGI
ncbi:MAG: TRAP transporter fused permease subunit [Alphaproteobacteria bacterium]|nr:TRAP transporter fused permease subunit [Alphaproteobacteria bacterium]